MNDDYVYQKDIQLAANNRIPTRDSLADVD
jgi:hypothetical protein